MKIAKAASIITIGFTLSRILGYVRLKALSYVFGATAYTDAYVAAFRVPDLLYFLLGGGALSAALIPIYTDLLAVKKRDEAREVAWTVTVILMLAVAFGVLLLELFMPFFVRVVFASFDPFRHNLTVKYSRILAPMVFFTVLSGIATGICQSHKRFAPPAFAYIFYNIPVIGATFWLGKTHGIPALCAGVIVGAFLLFAVQIPVLIREGLASPRVSFRNEKAWRVLALFLPAMAGIAVSQVNLFLVPTIFATRLAAGIVTDLEYATRVILLPLGIFGMAISQAIFPFLSEKLSDSESHQEDGDLQRKKGFDATLARGITSTFFFSLPSAFFLSIVAKPIISLLFAGGAFTPAQGVVASRLLQYFALGLPPLLALQVTVRGFHANQDTKTPLVTGLAALLVNIAMASILVPKMGATGIVLASSTAQWCNLFLHFRYLRRQLEFSLNRPQWEALAKMLLASLLVAALSSSALYFSESFSRISARQLLLPLFLLTGASSGIYLLTGYFLRVQEVRQLAHFLPRIRPQ